MLLVGKILILRQKNVSFKEREVDYDILVNQLINHSVI